MSLVAVPKPIFRCVVVATTGNFEPGRKDWSDADIQRWIKYWGGNFSPDLDDSVTHIVALPEEVNHPKKRTARVNSALKRKNIAIVKLEWLEDSIIHARKLPLDDYLLASGGRSVDDSIKAKLEKEKKAAIRDDEIGQAYPHPRRFTTYMDETTFRYEIVLTREDMGDRYQVKLFESTATPRTYHVGWMYYKSKCANPRYHKMEGPDAGVPFSSGYNEFARFFGRKTGVAWDDRVDAFHKGKANVAGHRFVYELPTRGKAIGLVRGEVPDLDTLTRPDSPGHMIEKEVVPKGEDVKGKDEVLQEVPTNSTVAAYDGCADSDGDYDKIDYSDSDGEMDINDDLNEFGAVTITWPFHIPARGTDEGVDAGENNISHSNNMSPAALMDSLAWDEGYSEV